MPRGSRKKQYRPDVNGPEVGTYRRNRAILFKRGGVCAICGGYVDKSYKFPHPLSPSVDHVIPVSKGGRSTMDNLQLTHLGCNKAKGARVLVPQRQEEQEKIFDLPQAVDWSNF